LSVNIVTRVSPLRTVSVNTLSFTYRSLLVIYYYSLCLSLQSSAVEQVLDILMDILSWEIAEVVSPCLPRGL